jgi:hypothetical protein
MLSTRKNGAQVLKPAKEEAYRKPPELREYALILEKDFENHLYYLV